MSGSCSSDEPAEDTDTGVLLEEDFSEVSERWSPDSYAGITSEISSGGYHVTLARRNQSWRESTVFAESVERPAVVVEARVVVDAAPKGATVGVTCESSPGDEESITGLFGHYEGVIGFDGEARIVRNLNDDEAVLATEKADLDLEVAVPIALELTCMEQDDEATVLFHVNGRRVAEAREDGPLAGYEGAGMSAAATEEGLDVTFDELRAIVHTKD